MGVIRPRNPRTRGTLWGRSLMAVHNGRQPDATPDEAAAGASVEGFFGRGNIHYVEINLKPYWFAEYEAGRRSIRWCLENHAMAYLGGASVSVYDQLAEAYRMGVRADLDPDPHDDGSGDVLSAIATTPSEYHRAPDQSPFASKYLFPFSSSESRNNARLMVAVVEEIDRLFPGIVYRVTASNEPYYQPRWSTPHTPLAYSDWVLDLYNALNTLPFGMELVAASSVVGGVPWGLDWQRTHLDRITSGIHFLWLNAPGGMTTQQAIDLTLSKLRAAYDAMLRPLRDAGLDPHDGQYASDELLEYGRLDPVHHGAVTRAVHEWHDQFGLSRNILSVDGAGPIYNAPWNVSAGRIHGPGSSQPAGTWTASAIAIDELYGAGGQPGPTPPPEPDYEALLGEAQGLAARGRSNVRIAMDRVRGALPQGKERKRILTPLGRARDRMKEIEELDKEES